MVIVEFSIQNKLVKFDFFEETFLLADNSMNVVLKMPFLALNNAKIQIDTENFT